MSKTNANFEHIKRAAIFAAVIIIAFLIIRMLLVPKTFYQFGYYRGDSVSENASRPLNYAESHACNSCHEDKHSTWAGGKHKTVSCETCHGALIKHTKDPTAVKPQKPRGRKFCAICHEAKISRPKKFPQINLSAHNPGFNCADCHNPHSPKLEQK